MRQHLFTAVSDYGWRTGVAMVDENRLEFNAGSGHRVTLTLKDVRKALREHKKALAVLRSVTTEQHKGQ